MTFVSHRLSYSLGEKVSCTVMDGEKPSRRDFIVGGISRIDVGSDKDVVDCEAGFILGEP